MASSDRITYSWFRASGFPDGIIECSRITQFLTLEGDVDTYVYDDMGRLVSSTTPA
jgi:hypothetical protein